MNKNGKTIAMILGLLLAVAMPFAARAQAGDRGVYVGIGGGSAEPVTEEGLTKKRNKVHMHGQEIFRTAVKNLSTASLGVLEDAGLQASDVDWVVAHQANLRILTQVADRVDVPMEKFVINIHEYGNTSSASIPIALDEAVRDGRIKPGQTVLMSALGAGISWGAALVRM